MEDREIVRLYWEREERAIEETAAKYGPYCKSVAKNILGSQEDAEECVNDTYLRAWNSMPTQWPERLGTYLGKITRNLAFNRYKHGRAQKRGGGETALVLEELSECISDTEDVEGAFDRRELVQALGAFARGLSESRRVLFVRRYWYAQAVSDIARDLGMRPEAVSKTLERTRKQLRAYLEKRGFEL